MVASYSSIFNSFISMSTCSSLSSSASLSNPFLSSEVNLVRCHSTFFIWIWKPFYRMSTRALDRELHALFIIFLLLEVGHLAVVKFHVVFHILIFVLACRIIVISVNHLCLFHFLQKSNCLCPFFGCSSILFCIFNGFQVEKLSSVKSLHLCKNPIKLPNSQLRLDKALVVVGNAVHLGVAAPLFIEELSLNFKACLVLHIKNFTESFRASAACRTGSMRNLSCSSEIIMTKASSWNYWGTVLRFGVVVFL